MSEATAPRAVVVAGGWSNAGTALSIVLGQPALWVLGSLAFLGRGGIILLSVPIWTLPTPVGLTTTLGPDAFDRGGLSARFLGAVGVPLLLALLLAIALGLIVSAVVEVISYERFLADPESVELRGGRERSSISRRQRVRLVLDLTLLQAALLVPLGVGVAAVIARMVAVVRLEQFLPSSLQLPLVVRVVAGAAAPLSVLLVTLVVCELLYASTSRELLAARFDTRRPSAASTDHTDTSASLGTVAVGVARTVATGTAAWSVTLPVLAASIWAITVAWNGVRDSFLGPGVLDDPGSMMEAGVVALLFVSLWTVVLLLIGFSTALRGALWTTRSLS